ncbi:FAD-binding oxidoreductase [Roseobacter sp.]|uniref:NAD(P)/FAD-dependent oxidoreductase n=1 Tax=Roseobacter sp. TaxID=1907202 RepID=UPI00329828DE
MSTQFPPSLWAETAPARQATAPVSGVVETDVAVIGAGFTGLSAAIETRRRGHAVTVIEAKAAGWGASGRNNGQVIPVLTSAEPDAWVARHGDAGRRMVDLIGNSAQVLFDLVRSYNMQAEAEQAGWFQPAHSPGRVALSQKRVAAWQRFGFPAELKTAAQAADLLGTQFWHGGMFNPTGGHINPLALAREMARVAQDLGAQIYEDSPVLSYDRVGSTWVIKTRGGTVKARALILATNAYTGELTRHLARRIARSVVPVLSWQMATPPIDDALRAQTVPGRQAVSDTRGDLRFFRYDARNRLITGGAVMGSYDMQNRVRKKAARTLAEAFPALGVPQMTHVWSGYVGMNWDRFPRVHKIGPDGWAWVACNGRGVALGTSLGRELARAATGQPEAELALPISDPQPFVAHGLVQRVAPTYLAWLKRQDKKEYTP